VKPSALFHKNLQIIKNLQPDLGKHIQERLDALGGELPSWQISETPQGQWVSCGDLAPFFQKGKTDEKVIKKRKKETAAHPVVLCYGVGASPYLSEFLRSLDKNTLAVVVIEPHVDLLLHTLDKSSIFQAIPSQCRISFVVHPERRDVEEALGINIKPLGTFPVTDCYIEEHAPELEAFKESFVELNSVFRETLRIAVEMLGNTAEDTLIGLRNMCLNAPWIWKTPSITELAERFSGLPVVSVGSGPSLEKNFRLLKGMENKCLIVAADTATPKLLREGIVPHIVITLERPLRMYLDYFRPLLRNHWEECGNILLIAESVSPSQVVGRWPGPVMVVGKAEIPVDKWIVNHGLLGDLLFSGASVVHVALSIAEICKASSLALIGQDLAYGEEGETHSEGIIAEEDAKRDKALGLVSGYEVPGINGGTVRTHISWLKMIRVYESAIPVLHVPVYDCTEGGALIRHTQVLPFQAYLENHASSEGELPETPASWCRVAAKSITFGRKFEALKKSLPQILQQLDVLERDCLDMEDLVKKTVAPGLPPERRQKTSLEVAKKLDIFHSRNRAIAFVGQSYAYYSGKIFAKVRRMETQEEVELWEQTWISLIDAHKELIRVFRYWVRHAFAALEWCRTREEEGELDKVLGALSPEDSRKMAEDLLAEKEGTSFLDTFEMMDIISLGSRSDPLEDGWPPELFWTLSLVYEQQGRNEQAFNLMRSASKLLEGTNFGVYQMGRFLLDAARIYGAPDYCHMAPYPLALSTLRQARRILEPLGEKGVCDDLEGSLRKNWNAFAQNHLENLIKSKKDLENKDMYVSITEAQMALTEKNIPEALELTWQAILDYAERAPKKMLPLYLWLSLLLPDLQHAEDSHIADTAKDILLGLGKHLLFLRKCGYPLVPEVAKALEEQGFSFQKVSGVSQGS